MVFLWSPLDIHGLHQGFLPWLVGIRLYSSSAEAPAVAEFIVPWWLSQPCEVFLTWTTFYYTKESPVQVSRSLSESTPFSPLVSPVIPNTPTSSNWLVRSLFFAWISPPAFARKSSSWKKRSLFSCFHSLRGTALCCLLFSVWKHYFIYFV